MENTGTDFKPITGLQINVSECVSDKGPASHIFASVKWMISAKLGILRRATIQVTRKSPGRPRWTFSALFYGYPQGDEAQKREGESVFFFFLSPHYNCGSWN